MLKNKMTLDFNSPSSFNNKRSKLMKTCILESPDLKMCKLGSPELERLIEQGSVGLVTPTPSAVLPYFMKQEEQEVTEEQELYAKGFVDALNELHRQTTTDNGTDQTNGHQQQHQQQHHHHQQQQHSGNGHMSGGHVIDITTTTANNININNNNNTSNGCRQQSKVVLITGGLPPPQPSSQLPPPPQPTITTANADDSRSTTTTTTTIQSSKLLTQTQAPQHHQQQQLPQPTPTSVATSVHQQQHLQQSNNNNNNNMLAPIDMVDQERIKLERKRLRNRIAASKCRRRKLERISRLEDKVKCLKSENSDLSIVINKLRDQVCSLKQHIMSHVNCGCHIQSPSTTQIA